MTTSSDSTPFRRAFWTCACITLLSSLISAGFSLAALNSIGDAHVNALYGASRSVAIAIVCATVAAMRQRDGTLTAAALMFLVQAGDTYAGLVQGDAQKTFGPAGLAIATAIAFEWLRRQPRLDSAA